jgi:hypothetical protein
MSTLSVTSRSTISAATTAPITSETVRARVLMAGPLVLERPDGRFGEGQAGALPRSRYGWLGSMG